MKEGGTSLNRTFREYNLVFKRLKHMNMAKNGFWMYFLLMSSADIGLKWAIKVVTILVGKQSSLTVMSLRLPKST